jgi:predicted P-loop ATPase
MVASWLDDDVVNQQVLVLVGRQGIFKTTWLEHLLPPELRAYGCKMANSSQLNKDERLRIAEYGLIALDEIDAMGMKELNVLKSLITASDVSERAAYGYTKERRIRLASFCASGNKQEFLTDLTGNRRWLPFRVENIANPFYITLPYEQIYAQALYLIDNGFLYWFDLDDIDMLEAHNEDFRAQENEEQLLSVYFDVPAEGYGQFMTTAEISDILVSRGSIKRPMPLNRLGMLLKQAGYKDVRRGEQRTRGWLVYERSMDEVNANRNKKEDDQ